MQIKYSVSLWNYSHYVDVPSLEHVITILAEQNYGIEFWNLWKDEDIFNNTTLKNLKYLLQGMDISLHTVGVGVNTFDLHKKQIDTAVDIGAKVVVLHQGDLVSENNSELDVELGCKIVEYAGKCGVKLALENGELIFLADAIKKIDGLGICLDVGHVYSTSDPMDKFLDILKKKIIHLHIQDVLQKSEIDFPYTREDHYIPGTGGISDSDWKLLGTTLKQINFRGIAVFEIRPRNPLQTAFFGKVFMQKLLGL